MIDLEALLQPISDAEPAGPDLEYDPDAQELERLSTVKAEQQFGDTVIAAEEPNWRAVSELATTLLARSKDVRSACLLARASVHQEQFAGLAAGLSLIHRLMEGFWDTVYPLLDAEDDNDPTMRMNALAALADPQGLLRDVRNTHLFRSRVHGELAVRQIEVAAGKAQARDDEEELSLEQIDRQLVAVLTEDGALAEQTRLALESGKQLSDFLDRSVGADRSPDLAPLIATLTTVNQVVQKAADQLRPADDETGEGDDGAGGQAAGGQGTTASAASGSIRSRDDVVLLLDKLCQYLERTEPSNPTPLLLRRAQRLMQMDFLEIMQDMAPGGISQVRVVVGGGSGSQNDDDDDD